MAASGREGARCWMDGWQKRGSWASCVSVCERALTALSAKRGAPKQARAQSAAREMNDSRYYQPLLLASTILLYPLAQPAISILSPPTPTPPPLPLRRPPIHHGQRRERVLRLRVRAHVRATSSTRSKPILRRGSLNCAFLHEPTTAPGPAAPEGVVRDWSRCLPFNRRSISSTLPANQPADRE